MLVGKLDPLGFEEDLVDLAPPPEGDEEQDAGQTVTETATVAVGAEYAISEPLSATASLGATEIRPVGLGELLARIEHLRSVLAARRHRYLLMNAPNDAIAAITAILPGMKSPTVMPLAEAGWSSIHTVIPEDKFWDIIDQLKANGAQGILVVPIEKMIL